MFKKNKRPNIFNHVNRNVIYPLYDPARDTNNNSTGIEIIEINSEDDHQTNPNNSEDKKESENDTYREYQGVELNREVNFNNVDNYSNVYADSMIDYEAIRSIYSEFYNNDGFDTNENKTSIHYDNLFTIVENEKSSSSEDDQYENFKLNKQKSRNNWDDNNSSYEDDVYNDLHPEEKNILIYSFKNTCYFTEIDLENNDSNTRYNDVQNDTSCSDRVPTPVPPYIPRFNLPLNPTLSTVTEISEPKQFASVLVTECEESAAATKKPVNRWLQDININYEKLPRPKSAGNICIGTQIPLKERNLFLEQESNIDVNNKYIKPHPQPNISLSSKCLTSNLLSAEPDIAIRFKSQDSSNYNSILKKDKQEIIGQVIIAQLIERIGIIELSVNEILRELGQALIKLTATMISESNTITLWIANTENDNVEQENENIKEVLDSPALRGSKLNVSENIHLEKVGSEFSNDIPRANTDVIMRTNAQLKTRTWFRKIIECFKCCK